MSKITPHGWRTRTSQYEPEAFDIVQPGLGAIALVKNERFALLIAAAPDLLEALKLVVTIASEAHDHWDNDRDAKVGKILIALSGHLPRYDKRIDELHAAIAKATGEQK